MQTFKLLDHLAKIGACARRQFPHVHVALTMLPEDKEGHSAWVTEPKICLALI